MKKEIILYQIQNFDKIVWIASDDPKYESRSQTAWVSCENCEKNDPEIGRVAYVYKNATGCSYVRCPRCGDTYEVDQFV